MLLPLSIAFGSLLLCQGRTLDDTDAYVKDAFKKVVPKSTRGPKSFDDEIVIIGAGPSGVHMAYLLKEKGFKKVKILEKSNRIGGKSTSVNYRGATHELGTVYISKDYEQNVIHLLNKFTNNTLIQIPMASVWSKLTPSGIPFAKYIFLKLSKKYPSKDSDELKKFYVSKIHHYVNLHLEMFGKYEGELMPEPREEVFKSKIHGSFMDFLKRNHLEDLQDLLTASFTLQGYGHLDDVPALYGLMWNTPKLMLSIVNFLNGENGGLYLLSDGFESLWHAMVEKLNISIELNIDVRYIHLDDNVYDIHGSNNKIYVYYKNKGHDQIRIESYDFLIWTPPVSMLPNLLGGKDLKEEMQLFSAMENTFYTTSLVDVYGSKRSNSPVDWWFDNIYEKKEMAVWASRESYAVAHGYYGYDYAAGYMPTGDDDRPTRTAVFYQYSKKKPNHDELQVILRKHLFDIGATTSRVIRKQEWPYFERSNQRNTEKGFHWRVLEAQGKHKIWFAGSSVSFESVKSVVEYNNLLIERMRSPQE